MAAQLGQARNALASLAGRVRSAVQPATQLVEKEVVDRYTKLIEANKEYVVKDKSAADKLMKQWFYTKLARCRRVLTDYLPTPAFLTSRFLAAEHVSAHGVHHESPGI